MADEKLIPGGVVHDLPGDLKAALKLNPEALATWQDITPLARNEWICWVQSPKKPETRRKRIEWGCSSLSDGKRRPCCWPGCPHREGMARARHLLLALLAVIGVLSVMPMAKASPACPLEAATASMPMMHHHGPSAPATDNSCPACLAVLASLPKDEGHVLAPAALSASLADQLSGIDPGLDPPPPRTA